MTGTLISVFWGAVWRFGLGGRFPGLRGCSTPVRRLFEEKGAVIHMETEVDRIDFDGKAVYARERTERVMCRSMIN